MIDDVTPEKTDLYMKRFIVQQIKVVKVDK